VVKRCFDESNKDYLYRMLFFEAFVIHPYQDGPICVSFEHLEQRREDNECLGAFCQTLPALPRLVGQRSTFPSMTNSGRTWTSVAVM
jgi:hypothetical protein